MPASFTRSNFGLNGLPLQPLPRIHKYLDPGGDVVSMPVGGIMGPVPAEHGALEVGHGHQMAKL